MRPLNIFEYHPQTPTIMIVCVCEEGEIARDASVPSSLWPKFLRSVALGQDVVHIMMILLCMSTLILLSREWKPGDANAQIAR